MVWRDIRFGHDGARRTRPRQRQRVVFTDEVVDEVLVDIPPDLLTLIHTPTVTALIGATHLYVACPDAGGAGHCCHWFGWGWFGTGGRM